MIYFYYKGEGTDGVYSQILDGLEVTDRGFKLDETSPSPLLYCEWTTSHDLPVSGNIKQWNCDHFYPLFL